jgi:DNA-directed RNA polymerase specialized sigma24 family protein
VASARDQPVRAARRGVGTRGGSAEDLDAVRSALAQLGPRMRAAVVLRHWLGYDVAECARLLSCSEGTVKSQTARGPDRLRELLSDDLSVNAGTAS